MVANIKQNLLRKILQIFIDGFCYSYFLLFWDKVP